MNFRKSVILIMAAIIYTIVLKIGIFLLPELFTFRSIIKIVDILSLFPGVSAILFGLYFIKEVIADNNIRLKISVYLAMVGPTYFMLVHLSKIIRISGEITLKIYNFSPWLYQVILLDTATFLSRIILWLSSIFILYFFYILYCNIRDEYSELKKANYWALVGCGLTMIFRSFGFFVYAFFPSSTLMHDPPKIIYLTGFLIFLFTSLIVLNFCLKLYRVENYTKMI